MGFRAAGMHGKAPRKEGGIAGEKTQVLLQRNAQRQIDFVTEVAAEAAQRIRAKHAPGGALPRPARRSQQKSMVVEFEGDLGMQRDGAGDAEIVQVSKPH